MKKAISLLKTNLKATIRSKHNEFLNLIENEQIREIINNNCYIAGGSLSSFIREEKPKDIDYFVADKNSLDVIREYFKDRYEISRGYKKEHHRPITVLNGFDDVPLYFTDNAVSLCDDFQIIFKDYGEPEEVCSRFDFVHCMGYYVPHKDELNVTLDTMVSSENKSLIYNIKSNTPITSAHRMAKLLRKEWNIDKYEHSKLMLNINQYIFNDDEIESMSDATHYDF